ncbi:hypothetical protein ACH5RR_033988 [Cinchona calisaya]|uniref:Uncharacterized protein n=1 Tax=Cinchona calisaya TaxID=153742 RepID=A0ABD2Y9K6_9GENT
MALTKLQEQYDTEVGRLIGLVSIQTVEVEEAKREFKELKKTFQEMQQATSESSSKQTEIKLVEPEDLLEGVNQFLHFEAFQRDLQFFCWHASRLMFNKALEKV